MAARAILALAQAEPPDEWPFHQCKWASLPAHLLWKGDRRMEAENYLSSGYGIRLALEERAVGWMRFGSIADVTQPSRLKGIQVAKDVGTPFLAATQVFDLRPVPRKFLALEKTDNSEERFVTQGTVLVTCSGSVGRATLATSSHDQVLISHDLLRVQAKSPEYAGWLYAYLRSAQARAMMTGAQYGHIIKHLEVSHLDALPVPVVTKELAKGFQEQTQRILELRNRAYHCTLEAERLFEEALGPLKVQDWGEKGFSVNASSFMQGRRRLEASYYNPYAFELIERINQQKRRPMRLDQVSEKVWWMTRFKRFYGEGGIRYLSADELFTTNPDESKKILVDSDDGHEDYFVKAGWLLMACSGQTYGLNGATCLATRFHENTFLSHDLIRIIPISEKIRPGYLLTTLSHPRLGRPALIRMAYGTSIPHLDPNDVSSFLVARLEPKVEENIADFAEESAALRAEADILEREMADEAGRLIDSFLAGDVVNFVVTMPAVAVRTTAPSASALPEHAVVSLRHGLKNEGLRKGARGTIVHVYEGGAGYEVEFAKAGQRPKVVTVEPSDIELV